MLKIIMELVPGAGIEPARPFRVPGFCNRSVPWINEIIFTVPYAMHHPCWWNDDAHFGSFVPWA